MSFTFYDLLILVVLVLCVCMGYRRGFVLTLCGFLAVFAGLIGASLISDLLAQPVMEFIRPMVENSLTSLVAGAAPDVSMSTESAAANATLQELLTALNSSHIYRGFAGALQELIGSHAAAVTAGVVATAAQYIALQIAKVVLFGLSFVLVLILWHMVSRVLDLAFRLPVLNTFNRWGGAAVGLLKGALLLFIAAWLLQDRFLSPEVIRSAPLLRFFCTTSPLDLLMKL